MWNKTLMRTLVVCQRIIKNPKNNKKYSIKFLIFKDNHCQPLLGLQASEQMNLVKIKENNFHHITSIAINDFKEVIDDKLCELPGVVTLQLKMDAVPIVMSNRRIPVAVCPQLNEEFSRLTKISVI